jgi:hypothetical protein
LTVSATPIRQGGYLVAFKDLDSNDTLYGYAKYHHSSLDQLGAGKSPPPLHIYPAAHHHWSKTENAGAWLGASSEEGKHKV